MTTQKNELSKDVIKKEFLQIDLKSIGVEEADFEQVSSALKDLGDLSPTTVGDFGKSIATKTSGYTDKLLDVVKNRDLDQAGEKLNQVVQFAQKVNTNSVLTAAKNRTFIGSILSKFRGAKQGFDNKFNTTREQMDALITEVEASQTGLKSRLGLLDQMFEAVTEEYKQLGIYVAAGKLKSIEIQNEISELTLLDQDQQTNQKIYDLNALSNSLEKRVSDLQVLQQSAMQTLPTIRIIQSNNVMLVDKFNAIKNITIPAWKNQFSLAISLMEQKSSVELSNAIDDATNDLLKRNAEMLHQNSVATAKANQRSVIDMETLEHVQQTLINTVNDVAKIQADGQKMRDEAAIRLKALQGGLQNIVLDEAKRISHL